IEDDTAHDPKEFVSRAEALQEQKKKEEEQKEEVRVEKKRKREEKEATAKERAEQRATSHCNGKDCQKIRRNGQQWKVCICGTFLLCPDCGKKKSELLRLRAHAMGKACDEGVREELAAV
ncbi:MAG TPA: hypothetical protein VJ521_01875, partial [Acidobacteriota bacterium]|nr:hypothetical protein [Acidobacteriota bacterium]